MTEPPGRGLGRWMLGAACVLGMVMLTLMFGTLEEQQRNPNREPRSRTQPGFVEVVLERNPQGHYLFSGAINGRPVEFLLDTGASAVVVPLALARELELPFGSAGQAHTANGVVTVYATTIERLQVGVIDLRDVRASINTGAQPDAILLGMSALKQIEFSQQGNQLTLRQSTE